MTQRQMEIIYALHSGLPREAPGSFASTRRAFSIAARNLPPAPTTLDVGCGPGASAVLLAELTRGPVVAVDIHLPYLRELRSRADTAGVKDRLHPVLADMRRLPFAPGCFDLIWSEGAVYNMGFDHGARELRSLSRPGGVFAVSELVWLRDAPPREAMEFWAAEYPAMRRPDENVLALREAGYDVLDDFILPTSDWTDDYYAGLERGIRELREQCADDPEAVAICDAEQAEIDLFRAHSSSYGYQFLVARRADR